MYGKGIEATHEITSREIDALSSAQLNLTKENSRLQEIISKKDKEIEDLSNPSTPAYERFNTKATRLAQ